MNTYEAMFLFDTSKATDYPAMEAEVGRLLQRAGAEILICKKWDERKLAYEIHGRRRGCYVLTYFKAPPQKIVELERDATLSEPILRLLVLRAEDVSEEQMRAPCPAEAAITEREARRRQLAEESGQVTAEPTRAAVAVAEQPERESPEPAEPKPTGVSAREAPAEDDEPA